MWKFRFKLSSAAVASVFLALAAGSQAEIAPPGAGVNLLNNPGFESQLPTFQSTSGPYAAGWNYTPGFDMFRDSWDLVSQTLPTTDLYYYDITFSLGTQQGEAGVDFGIFWDGTSVDLRSLAPSAAWTQYSYTVTGSGTSSDIGLVGNPAFWSSLSHLDVYWNGSIDPPIVPDSPIGFGLQAATLLGLCGMAGFWRRHALCSGLRKAG